MKITDFIIDKEFESVRNTYLIATMRCLCYGCFRGKIYLG